MRIHKNCVSSETIKSKCNGKKILYLQSLGYYPWILDENDKEIGRIIPLDGKMYLGDDVIIEKIEIYNNKKLSKELTEKHKFKILIFGFDIDQWN
jgi:hypothetical protein